MLCFSVLAIATVFAVNDQWARLVREIWNPVVPLTSLALRRFVVGMTFLCRKYEQQRQPNIFHNDILDIPIFFRCLLSEFVSWAGYLYIVHREATVKVGTVKVRMRTIAFELLATSRCVVMIGDFFEDFLLVIMSFALTRVRTFATGIIQKGVVFRERNSNWCCIVLVGT